MCEYCSGDKAIYADDYRKFFIAKKTIGSYAMFYKERDSMVAHGVKIDYCPMCGRRLKNEW